MTTYRCVVFDLDGTVIDSHAYTFAAFRFACAPYRQALSEAQIYASFGPDEGVILRRLVGAEHAVAAAVRLQSYYRSHLLELELDPRIVELLERCRAAELRCGLFTGRGMQSTRLLLESLHLSQYFGAVAAGDTVREPKPSGEGLLQIVRELGVEPEQTLLVGDSRLDLEAANAAGTDALLATWFARGVTRTDSTAVAAGDPHQVLQRLGLAAPGTRGSATWESPES